MRQDISPALRLFLFVVESSVFLVEPGSVARFAGRFKLWIVAHPIESLSFVFRKVDYGAGDSLID